MEIGGDVFQWWKNHEKIYPLLSQMAKSYLAIFASSADVERLFSTAGQIVSPLRTSLRPSKVEKILFCHRNIDRLDCSNIAEEIAQQDDK